jgi:hypothetical protein
VEQSRDNPDLPAELSDLTRVSNPIGGRKALLGLRSTSFDHRTTFAPEGHFYITRILLFV